MKYSNLLNINKFWRWCMES